MANYSFRNTETNEEFDLSMSMAERETYLEENPNIVQIFKKFPGVADPTRLGIRKPDDGFKDVLKKASVHKHNTINTW